MRQEVTRVWGPRFPTCKVRRLDRMDRSRFGSMPVSSKPCGRAGDSRRGGGEGGLRSCHCPRPRTRVTAHVPPCPAQQRWKVKARPPERCAQGRGRSCVEPKALQSLSPQPRREPRHPTRLFWVLVAFHTAEGETAAGTYSGFPGCAVCRYSECDCPRGQADTEQRRRPARGRESPRTWCALGWRAEASFLNKPPFGNESASAQSSPSSLQRPGWPSSQ